MKDAVVTRSSEMDGTFIEITCPCGGTGSTFVQRGVSPVGPVGYLPGDVQCDKCGQWFNSSGQPINDPANWSPYDAGEAWGEDDY